MLYIALGIIRGSYGGKKPPLLGDFMGLVSPLHGVHANPKMGEDPNMVGRPTHGFAHGFGDDFFLPMVLFRFGQGN